MQREALASDITRAPAAPAEGPGAKAPTARPLKKARPKKAPPRLRARWAIFDAGMKEVAVFDYNRRADAVRKLAGLLTRNKGLYYLQIAKDPMPEPGALEAPAME